MRNQSSAYDTGLRRLAIPASLSMLKEMNKLTKSSFLGLLFSLCFLTQSFSVTDFGEQDINHHLEEFSSFNTTHHDNIDDDFHVHSHKHSEDGEEHEHNHDHIKISHYEIHALKEERDDIRLDYSELLNLPGLFYKSLNSDAHLEEIFRPPIV